MLNARASNKALKFCYMDNNCNMHNITTTKGVFVHQMTSLDVDWIHQS